MRHLFMSKSSGQIYGTYGRRGYVQTFVEDGHLRPSSSPFGNYYPPKDCWISSCRSYGIEGFECSNEFFGGYVKNYKQALIMPILVIFATATLFAFMGCAKSKDISGEPQAVVEQPAPATDPSNPSSSGKDNTAALQPVPVSSMPECTDDEFADLVAWSNDLAAAKQALAENGNQKNEAVIKLALSAIKKCDQAEFYHSVKYCKKTTKVITTGTTVRGYDAFTIHNRCAPIDSYLKKLNMRPDPKQSQPAPPRSEPSIPKQPVPQQPTTPQRPPAQPPVDAGQLPQCNSDEFAKLNAWRGILDVANKKIAKFEDQTSWKYDAGTIESAKAATLSCESVISHHDANPCQREKAYTGQTLREQCTTARTYYYNFAQRNDSMIVSGAKLYLQTSVLADRTFHPGPAEKSYGNCVITNQSSSVINYTGQKALITESRVYTNAEDQMFVLLTQEGLKLECYGMKYSSAATSLTEVMRLLAAEETKLPMSYELN